MKKNFILPALGLLLLASCETQDEAAAGKPGDEAVVSATSAAFVSEKSANHVKDNGVMRSVVNPTGATVTFNWADDDKLAIYAGSDATGLTNLDIVGGAGSQEATFRANGFSLTPGSAYYAFFPYNANSTDKTGIDIDYSGMVQTSDGSYDHLGAKDYQYSAAVTAVGAESVDKTHFEMNHLGAVVRFVLKVPATGVYKNFSMSASSLVSKGTFNITDGTLTASSENSGVCEMKLGEGGNGIAAEEGSSLTLYMMVAPADLTATGVTVSLTAADGSKYSASIAGKNVEAGKAYGFKAELTNDLPCGGSIPEGVDLGIEIEKDGEKYKIIWADWNVGASKPEEYGRYYQWGDVVGMTPGGEYTATTYKETKLTSYHDAANVNWGDGWRMPTAEEVMTLFKSNITREWVDDNDRSGILFTGSNGKQLLLTCAGSLIDSGNNAGKLQYDAKEGGLNKKVRFWTSDAASSGDSRKMLSKDVYNSNGTTTGIASTTAEYLLVKGIARTIPTPVRAVKLVKVE